MGIELKMPALSPTMEEGTLARWLKKEGDEVSSGDIIAEIETDKATMEFEAVDEGVIEKILVPEGTENVKVGTVIATIAGDGDASAAASAATPEASAAGKAGCTSGRRSIDPRRNKFHRDYSARSLARRDGGRNAPRRPGLRNGRGSRGVPGCL